jgi:hypothetical protein
LFWTRIFFLLFYEFLKNIGLEQKKNVKSRHWLNIIQFSTDLATFFEGNLVFFCKFSIFHRLFPVWLLTLEMKLLGTFYRLDFFDGYIIGVKYLWGKKLWTAGVWNYFLKINNCFHGFWNCFFCTINMSWHAFRNKKCVSYQLLSFLCVVFI